MANWFLLYRDGFIITLAILIVILPIGIGVFSGRIPKHFFTNWAVSVSGVTFLMAMGVQFVEHRLKPLHHFLVSSVFGLIWIMVGLYLSNFDKTFVQQFQETGPYAARLRKMISTLFFLFGLVWIVISGFQYLKR